LTDSAGIEIQKLFESKEKDLLKVWKFSFLRYTCEPWTKRCWSFSL
jgi:hypothetical protein